ncbi:MAG: DUF4388 domain-containing protein [Nitrospirota bacterium]
MEFIADNRLFKRYRHKSEFYIIIEGNYYKASTIDFSLNGLCIFIEGLSSLPLNSMIDIKIDEMDLDIKARVVWTKKTGSNLIAGLEKMEMSGILKYYPLSDLLLDIQRSDTAGVLEIRNASVSKKIYIKNGVMVFATSNQQDDRLEEILLRTGKISNDQYYQSLDVMREKGKPQMKVLVELGYLNPIDLVQAVKYQVEEIILSLFSYEDGVVAFTEGLLPPEAITLKLSAANLIFHGIKRINNPEYFKRVCPPVDTILYYSSEPVNLFQDISFTEKDRHVLSLIDSKLTIKEMLSISPIGDILTIKILCAFLSTRMIEVKERGFLEDKSLVEILREPQKGIDSEFEEKVENLYRKYRAMDYYSILGIERHVAVDKIRKAYYKAAKEFHPDRHLSISSESMKGKLSAIFAFITDAYKTLSDPVEREKYDKGLLINTSKTKANNIVMALQRFQEGQTAFEKGLYSAAVELFGQAIYLDSTVPVYHFYLGLTNSKLNKLRVAEKEMSKAIEMDPFNADYITELGYVYLALGLKLRAKSTFEKAMKLAPSNKKTLKGLEQI